MTTQVTPATPPPAAVEPIETILATLRKGGYAIAATAAGVTASRQPGATLSARDAQPLLLQLMRRQSEAIAATREPEAGQPNPDTAEALLSKLRELGAGWQLVTTPRGPALPVWRNEADAAAFTEVVVKLMGISPRVYQVPEGTDPVQIVAMLKGGMVRA